MIILGGIILFYKGYLLLKEANIIHPDIEIISLVMATAFIIGLLKNKFIMSKFNRHNIKRINELKDPKIHQFLSNLASGNYTMLLIIGGFDLALSTALLKSSTIFFMNKSLN